MKASELIKELTNLVKSHGDCVISISCKEQPETLKAKQGYYVSQPAFIVPEAYEEGMEFMIRDWPY